MKIIIVDDDCLVAAALKTILEVNEEDGEEILVPIEDEDTFDEIAGLFEERLADLYEIEDLEPSELN